MSDAPAVLDDQTLKFGLLMETAQVHQRVAETHLEQLRLHTRDIDDLVREEIRRTLVEELRALTEETQQTARTLRALRRSAAARSLVPSLAAALLCAAIPAAAARWFLPSAAELSVLRAQRDALAANVAALERRGARIEWRACGPQRRLCVRVDPGMPGYGAGGNYHIVTEGPP